MGDIMVPRSTEVQQWDGDAYHTVARWAAESVEWRRHVPYDRRWPFIYWEDGVLFQFDDTYNRGSKVDVIVATERVPAAQRVSVS